MKNFVLLGAAGYVAPRHMAAIRAIGGNLVAVCDPHDSVGILDSYFPDCLYFREFERLDRFCSKKNPAIDYVVVCSPNHLHDSHSMWGMRMGASVICEKPVTLTIRNLKALQKMETDLWKRVFPVLQLRRHPNAGALRSYAKQGDRATIEIVYNAPRGNWYEYSWKGDIAKSGGLASNIGVHLFDLVLAIFGPAVSRPLIIRNAPEACYGELTLEKADVRWRLSINKRYPAQRDFIVNGESLDFSSGFAELHETVYREILAGNGHSLEDAKPAIQVIEHIRTAAKMIS